MERGDNLYQNTHSFWSYLHQGPHISWQELAPYQDIWLILGPNLSDKSTFIPLACLLYNRCTWPPIKCYLSLSNILVKVNFTVSQLISTRFHHRYEMLFLWKLFTISFPSWIQNNLIVKNYWMISRFSLRLGSVDNELQFEVKIVWEKQQTFEIKLLTICLPLSGEKRNIIAKVEWNCWGQHKINTELA